MRPVPRCERRTVIMTIESAGGMADLIDEDTSYQEILGMVVTGALRCAVSGRALELVISAAMMGGEAELVFLHMLLEHASVFGRMRPRNKQRVCCAAQTFYDIRFDYPFRYPFRLMPDRA